LKGEKGKKKKGSLPSPTLFASDGPMLRPLFEKRRRGKRRSPCFPPNLRAPPPAASFVRGEKEGGGGEGGGDPMARAASGLFAAKHGPSRPSERKRKEKRKGLHGKWDFVPHYPPLSNVCCSRSHSSAQRKEKGGKKERENHPLRYELSRIQSPRVKWGSSGGGKGRKSFLSDNPLPLLAGPREKGEREKTRKSFSAASPNWGAGSHR